MSAKLHPPSKPSLPRPNPLPPLIQTPSGLALLELQGAINLPQSKDGQALSGIEIGSIDFPDYVPDAEGSAWMRRVHMYVGRHQRLTGEVKKLSKAIAVIRRRENRVLENSSGTYREQGENLEVVEIIKYKIMFSNRPEPVGTANAS
ncbi:Chromosome transmission fidelity protein 8 [Metarhizium album ARSEF 1941]|uniref:Chromosome transmission fidelity protein 8 n=1 Tax=Metarhizium album (strain ARSEF 1941) TaxID=1081103 RepID=A0A0B2WSB7_METAS|nr:Chromosome transmission fidelity protein 8 [Metarhizium album ARSEF 1941]KHN95845.1 Chromosome transmission fidelity protein 8 [Metarhizium album ARSEF 1941]